MQRDPANLEAIMELFGPEKELEVIGTSAVYGRGGEA
jgi:hypothetical protein